MKLSCTAGIHLRLQPYISLSTHNGRDIIMPRSSRENRQKANEYVIESAARGQASPKDRKIFTQRPQIWLATLATKFERATITRSTIEAILTADGRSGPRIHVHANSNSKPISSLLLTRKRQVQSNMWVHTGVKRSQPAARCCHHGSPAKGTACIRGYTDIDPWILWCQSTDGPRVFHGKHLPCRWPVL